jgi:hypothetical protein
MNRRPLTLCLTIGGRPDHLRRTLASLRPSFPFAAVIAINDFRDEATNAVFRAACPDALLINPDDHLGHHRALDRLYRLVRTPYVFHCEDDWLFEQSMQWEPALNLLERHPQISQVCLRKTEDFNMSRQERSSMHIVHAQELTYARLDLAHPHWHGFTFNPHIASINLWRQLGGFSRFSTEWHLSRAIRAQGRFVAYQHPGACVHIGDDRSMALSDRRLQATKWIMRHLLWIDI